MWDTGAATLPAFLRLRRWGEGPQATKDTWLSAFLSQLQNQNELRAPTAEKAAFYLDAALAARSTSRAGCGEDARRTSHMLFTLHVYQYRVEKCGQGGSRCMGGQVRGVEVACLPTPRGGSLGISDRRGGGGGCGSIRVPRLQHLLAHVFSVSGGRSRLHLIDLGSCEAALSRGGEASGGPLCLSLSALGSVILALVNGAKHVPYR